jgi:enoyl-CoA hydratase
LGHVTLHQESGIARLTLEAAPMNTLTRAMVVQLGELLAACARDPEVGAVVVHGSGTRAFSAGSDLAELRGLVAQGETALAAKFAQDRQVFGALAQCPKPTIAAIEGAAIGGGLELAVCCDFVLAGRGAKLGLPEIRLGVFPGSGGTVRVTRRIGGARARRMMLLGGAIDAPTALAWGLVDELCEPGDALAAAMALALRLAAGPRLAQEGCKAAIAAASDCGEDAALDVAQRWALKLGCSADLAEGLRAFDEKRAPRFGGS